MLSKKYEELREADRQEGEARGRAEGHHAGLVLVAKRMLKAGMPVSQVSKITELSEEEIQKLQYAVAH